MEFFCVLSVGGSLASYLVQKESESAFKAVLRTVNGKRDDIPFEFTLERKEKEWLAQPWHEEIAPALIQAIQGNGR